MSSQPQGITEDDLRAIRNAVDSDTQLHAALRRERQKTECPVCGETFLPDHDQQFCSFQCAIQGRYGSENA